MSDLDANREVIEALNAAYQLTDTERLETARLVVDGLIVSLRAKIEDLPAERQVVSARIYKDELMDIRDTLTFIFGHSPTTD